MSKSVKVYLVSGEIKRFRVTSSSEHSLGDLKKKLLVFCQIDLDEMKQLKAFWMDFECDWISFGTSPDEWEEALKFHEKPAKNTVKIRFTDDGSVPKKVCAVLPQPQMNGAHQRVKNLRDRIGKIQNNHATKVQGFQTRIGKLRENLKTKQENHVKKVEAMKGTIGNLKEKVQKVRENLTQRVENQKECVKKVRENWTTKFQNNMNKWTTQNENLKKKLVEVRENKDQKIKNVQETVQKKNQRIKNMQGKIQKKNQRIKNMQAKLQKKNEMIQSLKKELNDLKPQPQPVKIVHEEKGEVVVIPQSPKITIPSLHERYCEINGKDEKEKEDDVVVVVEEELIILEEELIIPPTVQPKKLDEFQRKIELLKQMGFVDSSRLMILLKKYGGNVQKVLAEILI